MRAKVKGQKGYDYSITQSWFNNSPKAINYPGTIPPPVLRVDSHYSPVIFPNVWRVLVSPTNKWNTLASKDPLGHQ